MLVADKKIRYKIISKECEQGFVTFFCFSIYPLCFYKTLDYSDSSDVYSSSSCWTQTEALWHFHGELFFPLSTTLSIKCQCQETSVWHLHHHPKHTHHFTPFRLNENTPPRCSLLPLWRWRWAHVYVSDIRTSSQSSVTSITEHLSGSHSAAKASINRLDRRPGEWFKHIFPSLLLVLSHIQYTNTLDIWLLHREKSPHSAGFWALS